MAGGTVATQMFIKIGKVMRTLSPGVYKNTVYTAYSNAMFGEDTNQGGEKFDCCQSIKAPLFLRS